MKITTGMAVELAVNVLQLTSSANFQSPKANITYDAPGMNLSWLFQTPDGVVTRTQVMPTTFGGDYDWAHLGAAMYKIGVPASGGASINNDATGYGWFRGVCDGVLPWASPIFEFVPANVTGSLVKGTSKLETDIASLANNQFAAQVLARKNYACHDEAYIVVEAAATDLLRGTALKTAYAAATGLTPGGESLSESNRAAVLIPPGNYNVTSALAVNTDFVDLIALVPERGGDRQPTDWDQSDGSTSLANFRPPRTVVYSTTNDVDTVFLTATNVRMRGFAIAQLSGDATGNYSALFAGVAGIANSQFDEMYFWHKAPDVATGVRRPVGFAKHVDGTWRNCISNTGGWRVGLGNPDDGQFSATMINCQGGSWSFIGDYVDEGTHKAINSRMIRCKSIGGWDSFDAGESSFSGCGTFACEIDSTCYFEDCESGDNSFGIGNTNAGMFVNCRGGNYCFASTTGDGSPAEFSGTAIGCHGGAGSFGGRFAGIGANGKLTGTLIGCSAEDSALPWRIEGATIEGCLLTVAADGEDCITLLDSLSRIHNSTLLVLESGTGVPIDAGSALTVSAAGNRYNNADTTATGLGANVTNQGIGDV